jgi:hypothetical protein
MPNSPEPPPETGAEWISLVVTQYQERSLDAISATDNTATEAYLIHAIETAHGLLAGQLSRTWILRRPHALARGDRAGLHPEQWEPGSPLQAFLDHYALLAEAHGVEQFCVGTELSGTEGHTSEWRAVIAGVREVYGGPITYASNWGDETGLAWWDAVDFIGVDAYYPLAEGADPTLEELKAAWEPHHTLLGDLAESWDKTNLFTEIGYPQHRRDGQHPWDWQIAAARSTCRSRPTPIRPSSRASSISPGSPASSGGIGDGSVRGRCCDDGYTPTRQAREDVLRAGFGAPPRVPPLAPPPDYRRGAARLHGWAWRQAGRMAVVWHDRSGRGPPVYRGTRSISATSIAGGRIALYHAAFDSSPYGCSSSPSGGRMPGSASA